MIKDEIAALLSKTGQNHLTVGLGSLTPSQLEKYLQELKKYTPSVSEQKEALMESRSPPRIEPLKHYDLAGNLADQETGFQLIASGKVGCLVLAGGQGTRVGGSLPKGLIAISPIQGKTLLQLICEKIAAASKQAKRKLQLAILTSPLNHAEIESYLQKNQFFGLSPDQVDLFSQQMLPFTDDRGNFLLAAPGKLAMGPNGNGDSLKLFYESGIWAKWHESGVMQCHVIPIDNPLALPLDAELAGYHSRLQNEVSLKSIFRHNAEEKVGVLGTVSFRLHIQEYFELPSNNSAFHIANIGLFAFSMAFIKRMSSIQLPWHLARKTANVLLTTAGGSFPETVKVWKFERFIFDLFPLAEKWGVLIYPREDVYAPLKNSTGEKSAEAVKEALSTLDRKLFEKISGSSPPKRPFELGSSFHYPTPDLIKKWQGKPLPEADYIED